MTLNNDTDAVVQHNGYQIFLDGNTLVITLPAVIDLSLYTSLYYELEKPAGNAAQQILLDFSSVTKLCASGIAAFISLSRLAQERRIRLLILDPPIGVSRQLDPILPAATWIDSYQDASIDMDLGDVRVA